MTRPSAGSTHTHTPTQIATLTSTHIKSSTVLLKYLIAVLKCSASNAH